MDFAQYSLEKTHPFQIRQVERCFNFSEQRVQVEKGGIDQHQPIGMLFTGDSAMNHTQSRCTLQQRRG